MLEYALGIATLSSVGALFWASKTRYKLYQERKKITRLQLMNEATKADFYDSLAKAKLYEQVVVNAKDGIVITKADPVDLPGPKIVYINKAFTELTGYTLEELRGKSPRILQGLGTDKKTLTTLKEHLKKGIPYTGELLNYAKDQTPYWLDISIVPIHNEKGELKHFAAIERDITYRKHVEQDIIQAKNMAESAVQTKSSFLANMSHELRTPMNGIIGLSKLLLDSTLNDEQRESTHAIAESADALLVLLNDILDFSKIEAGELTLEAITFPCQAMVEDTLRVLKPLADKKGLRLDIQYDPVLNTHVVGDPSRLRQILTNLVGNAVKFTETGHINVMVTSVARDGEADLTFTVEDTGIGMPEDVLETIFDKFTQADESTARKFGGTGLGLAISKQLVEAMDGTIEVESTLGQGSIFRFTVPLPLGETLVEPVSTPASIASSNNQHDYVESVVLVVDDHSINLMFAEKLLHKLGVPNVKTVESGIDALAYLKEHTVELVLMDCQMPGMDGFEACRNIRALEHNIGKTLPVVAMTAHAMVGDREKCLKAGMDDYISKPVTPEKMTMVLERWLGNAQHQEEEIAVNTSPNETAQAPVDLDHLAMYTDGDKDEEREIIDLFIEQADISLAAIQEAAETQDQDAWCKATHKLRGAAMNFGAFLLAEVCATAEEEPPAGKESFETVALLIQDSLNHVRAYMTSDL